MLRRNVSDWTVAGLLLMLMKGFAQISYRAKRKTILSVTSGLNNFFVPL